ncbi:MAG: EAL domain-containing protein, partial [Erysipelotrichaceae bacterium]
TEESLFSLDYCIRLLRTKDKKSILYVDDSVINAIRREVAIADLLVKQIKDNSFQVYYQPIHSIKDNAFTLAEALLRLYHDDLGWIAPEEFIPIAESKGFIIDIGYIVISKVCEFAKEIERQNINFESISINLSPIQLTDLNIAKKIKDIIRKSGVSASKISFEIAESAFIRDFGSVKAIMNELREAGIVFYLDDFGSGYSNLASIIRLDFKYVKLDKSLLSYSTKYRQNELIGGFIKVFNELGISVVVEGIETQNQLEIVKEHKANYIQGFYFAKPVSEKDLIAFMIKQDSIKK